MKRESLFGKGKDAKWEGLCGKGKDFAAKWEGLAGKEDVLDYDLDPKPKKASFL